MSTVRRQILLNVFKIFDLAMMVFSFLLATIAVSERAHSGGPAQYLSMRIKVSNFAILLDLNPAFKAFSTGSRLTPRNGGPYPPVKT